MPLKFALFSHAKAFYTSFCTAEMQISVDIDYEHLKGALLDKAGPGEDQITGKTSQGRKGHAAWGCRAAWGLATRPHRGG